MSRYVQRDAGGNIIGWFENPQPGMAEELLDDGAPDWLTFMFNVRRRAKVAAAAAVLAAKIDAGFTWSGNTYQLGADKLGSTGIANITSKGADAVATVSVPGARPWPADFAFRAVDNTEVPMTAEDMIAFALAASDYVTNLRKHYWALQAQILAAADDAALEAIDIETGWPA